MSDEQETQGQQDQQGQPQDLPRGEPARHVGGSGAGQADEGEVRECPRCHATNRGDAAFCEGCGLDLVTGVTPPEPGEDELPATRLQSASPHQVYAEPDRDADDIALPVEPWQVALDEDGLEQRPNVPPPTPPAADESEPAHRQAQHQPPSLAGKDWVVELWVDGAWHSERDTGQPLPPMGLPQVIPVTSSNLVIGRTSVAQGLHPDIDCGTDAGVSVRHAQLTSDGERWWVEDLDTSNGTYVGTVGQPGPDAPIEPGARVQVDQADRIWLGSWTRLVVREARESEREARAGEAREGEQA